ncbi:hypothetical protein GCM10007086_33720 [Photobacterium aphoticum]|nr:hypothetical protein GCM10007086_33720 [Photobacterium aphoticum]
MCFLLILTFYYHALPLSLGVCCLYFLWLEAEQWLWCHVRQQGRLVIGCDGQVTWRGQAWRLRRVTVRTPWLLVMQLQRVPGQTSSRPWLAIAPDSCCPKTYHRLMLFARYPDGMTDYR